MGHKRLLTFGGAYSNHILATAVAANENNLQSIGVIRGAELQNRWKDNPTLSAAVAQGMKLYFMNREKYRSKNENSLVAELKAAFGDFYLLPEGGTNALAIKGCEEILNAQDEQFDFVCCSVGTGGTVSGLINSSFPNQQVLGFSSLKGDFLNKEIKSLTKKTNWKLITDYHFGGYGKLDVELINFMNQFKKQFNITLDPVYTGKLFYGLFDLIKNGYFRPESKILVIHTGGIQGIFGMNAVLKKKKLPLLEL